MKFKCGDRVIIAGNRDDAHYGKVATVMWANNRAAQVTCDGETIVYDLSRLSTIPESLLDSSINPGYYWNVDVEFNTDTDAPMQLSFDSQPTVNWGNGMVRIDADNEMHLFPVLDIAHIHVWRKSN